MEQRETMKATLGVNPETATRPTSSTSEVKKKARHCNGERRSSGCLLGSDIKVNTLYGKGDLGTRHHLSALAGSNAGVVTNLEQSLVSAIVLVTPASVAGARAPLTLAAARQDRR